MKRIILLLVGIIFIFSSLLKLISVNQFELFIYNLGILNFNTSSILARIIISIEFLLGLLINIKNLKKICWSLSLIMLGVFSAYLVVHSIYLPDNHCHCFGELIIMKPVASLLKNLVLILLLLYVKNAASYLPGINKIFAYAIVVAGLIIPNILSPPDFLVHRKTENLTGNKIYRLKEIDTEIVKDCFTGKKALCFLSPACKQCKNAAKKISIMAKRYNLEKNIIYIFMGNEKKINDFFISSETLKFPYIRIRPKILLDITNRSIPKIFIVEDGNVKRIYSYQNLSENELKRFFNTE